MNKEISTTIEEITNSVNHSHNGIESKNPDEITNFVAEIIPLIKKFNNQIKHSENKSDEYCLNFREDISNLYDYLFIQGTLIRYADTSGDELRKIFNKLSAENENIFNLLKKAEKDELQSADFDELIKEIPEGTIILNEAPIVLSELIAIKHNGNPFEILNLKKSVKEDPLKDFISIYPAPKKVNESEPDKTAIYAFYYHILHSIDPKTRFENNPKGKMYAIESIAQEKGISPKAFQLKYNELENKPETRISQKKIRILQGVIKLLTDYPAGLKLANEYLDKSKE